MTQTLDRSHHTREDENVRDTEEVSAKASLYSLCVRRSKSAASQSLELLQKCCCTWNYRKLVSSDQWNTFNQTFYSLQLCVQCSTIIPPVNTTWRRLHSIRATKPTTAPSITTFLNYTYTYIYNYYETQNTKTTDKTETTDEVKCSKSASIQVQFPSQHYASKFHEWLKQLQTTVIRHRQFASHTARSQSVRLVSLDCQFVSTSNITHYWSLMHQNQQQLWQQMPLTLYCETETTVTLWPATQAPAVLLSPRQARHQKAVNSLHQQYNKY